MTLSVKNCPTVSEAKVIKLSTTIDHGLVYLIQQTNQQRTEEILGFFTDLSYELLNIGMSNMTGQSIRKNVIAMYPDTAIPFNLLLTCRKNGGLAVIIITFAVIPFGHINMDKLQNTIQDSLLLGGEGLASIPRPEMKVTKIYQELIAKATKTSIKRTKDTAELCRAEFNMTCHCNRCREKRKLI